MKNLIGITRVIPQSGIELLEKEGIPFKVWPHETPPDQQGLIEFLKDCTGAITMLSDQLNPETLNQLPQCKILANYAVGYNNIDADYCKGKGIIVTNTPDVLTEATAELALALLLTVARKIIPAHYNVQNQKWKTWVPTGFIGKGLKGKTLGIVGPGRIAKAFAEKCHRAFDMNIIYSGPREKETFNRDLKATYFSLEELCKMSDVISLHCPLNDQTLNLIGKKELMMMKDQVILINTARGEVINQKDLEEILPQKDFMGIGLDVTTPEPIKGDSPLLKDPRVVILPHIGSANSEAREAMSKLCAENIVAYLKGQDCLTPV